MSNKKNELLSEYESTYLAYADPLTSISFEDWLVMNKGYKSQRKSKEQLIDRLLNTLEADIAVGDFTVLEELLGYVPIKNLIQALGEEEWVVYEKLKKIK